MNKLERPIGDVDDESEGSSQAVAAWQILREDILSGELAPQTRLRIGMLNRKYKIGPSPLREALSRLVSDNLVVSLDRRGFMVVPISLPDFRDLTDMRKMLEKQALEQSLKHGDEKWEAALVAALYRLERVQERIDRGDVTAINEWEGLNKEYHDALVSACPSGWLLRLREQVYVCAERYRRICLSTKSVERNVKQEHDQIRTAALARNMQVLGPLIDQHLERTFNKVASSGKL
ncbi:GntR family transcriptional regulator [Mesorhizobium yinganensis]|uniref:GntR family transcriptional regulator n=1 Tax=Mesorhizobium yinganensis TaxID=3157707 RepID=UPI0032B82DA6